MNLGLLRSRCHLIDRALFFLHIQFPGLEFQNISLNFRENALLFYAPLHNPTPKLRNPPFRAARSRRWLVPVLSRF